MVYLGLPIKHGDFPDSMAMLNNQMVYIYNLGQNPWILGMRMLLLGWEMDLRSCYELGRVGDEREQNTDLL